MKQTFKSRYCCSYLKQETNDFKYVPIIGIGLFVTVPFISEIMKVVTTTYEWLQNLNLNEILIGIVSSFIIFLIGYAINLILKEVKKETNQ